MNIKSDLNESIKLRCLSEIDAYIGEMDYYEKFGFLRRRLGLSKILRLDSNEYEGLIAEYLMDEISDPAAWDLKYEIEKIANPPD